MSRLTKMVGGLALVGAVAAIAMVSFGWPPFGEEPAEDQVETAQVERRTFSSTIRATGSVEPKVGAEVEVGARVSGKVGRLHVNVGDRVEEGQLLAVLESEDLQARVDRRQAELDQAEADLAAVQSGGPRQIDQARAEVDRWRAEKDFARDESVRQRQLADQDYASKQARDAALKQLAVSTARLDGALASLANAEQSHRHDLERARARVRAARAALVDARTQLAYATIRAPIDGTVASVSTDEGETVAAGLQAPTFVTIIDLDRLRVDAFVDEVDIAKVEPDQEVQFSVDAHPARDFEGRVRTIYPNALTDDDVIYYRVVIDLSPPDTRLLRPKMTTDVTIFRERRDDVLAVPARSIERVEGRDVVYSRAGPGVEPRPVKLGARDGQWVEVVEGLDGGETIFLEPPSPNDPS